MTPSRPRLAARRKARGFTQEELAYALGVDRSTVARWEAGETDPQPWARRKLGRTLGLSADALDELLALDTTAAQERPVNDERGAVQSADDVRDLLDELAARYLTQPSAALLVEAAQCHGAVSQLMTAARSDGGRRPLHHLAVTTSTLLSQLIWDASGRRDAVTAWAYCDEAAQHAAACGDVAGQANADLRKTFIALYAVTGPRDPARGLATAEGAALASKSLSPALSGLAQLHAAEALAMMGEYRRCEQSLSLAETAFDRIGADDPAADVHAPGQLGRLAGSCYLALGTPERAEPLLARTADELRGRDKTRSLVLGNLALSYLRQRQLDAATATLHEAIGLLEQSRGGGGMTVVFGVARELYPWRELAAVQDVHDRLLALMA